jgi:hypothetical protein
MTATTSIFLPTIMHENSREPSTCGTHAPQCGDGSRPSADSLAQALGERSVAREVAVGSSVQGTILFTVDIEKTTMQLSTISGTSARGRPSTSK